jgi:flavin-dependent dehydrogenase
MINVDVLIIGGGPAGSSLGYLLKKNGFSTCIVEKHSFPRTKLCGGLLTQKTVNLIDKIYGGIDFPCEHITSDVNLYLGTHLISSVTTEQKFYLVERKDFDSYLIMRYKNISGLLFEKSKLTLIDPAKNIAITDKNETIQYKVIVGADGANSQIRKYIDNRYRPNALCLECNSLSENLSGGISIYLSVVRSGYGWCFSKKNRNYSGSLKKGGGMKSGKNIIFVAWKKR